MSTPKKSVNSKATVHRSSTGPSVAAVTLPVPVAPGPELLDPSPRAPDSELPGEENAWAELQKYLRMLCKEESNGWLEAGMFYRTSGLKFEGQ